MGGIFLFGNWRVRGGFRRRGSFVDGSVNDSDLFVGNCNSCWSFVGDPRADSGTVGYDDFLSTGGHPDEDQATTDNYDFLRE